MNKDNYRDYVTEAFRYYAMCGRPCAADIRKVRTVLPPNCRGGVADLEAVSRTIERLAYEKDGQLMRRTLETVYFADPRHFASRGEISRRVGKASMELCVSEATVYRMMRRLRLLMAIERGLRVDEDELVLMFDRTRNIDREKASGWALSDTAAGERVS